MDKRTLEILAAARTMFGRYGFSKTTMSDIAQEAGLSRQTLYNAFDSKEDILRAGVLKVGGETIAVVESAWKDLEPLEAKLAAFQRLGPKAWFEEIRAHPDWGDIIEGMYKSAAAELAHIDAQWVDRLTALFEQHGVNADGGATAARSLADFFYFSSKNAKYGADTAEMMDARLKTILAATMALAKQ